MFYAQGYADSINVTLLGDYEPPNLDEVELNRFGGDFFGDGYLAGEAPSGLTTLKGDPISATVRVLYRDEASLCDGVCIATVQSNEFGEWIVEGVNPDAKFDVVGRLADYNDTITANVAPIPINYIRATNYMLPNANFDGMDGFVELFGGKMPYSLDVIGTPPDGITITLDGNKIYANGTTTDPDGAYYVDVKITSDNEIELELTIGIFIGFNAPTIFGAQKAPIFRPTWFKNQKLGLFRPTWLKVKALELD